MGTPQTTDAKSPVATCSQRQQKVQLLPIRYAIVEQDYLKKTALETYTEKAITNLSELTNKVLESTLKSKLLSSAPYPKDHPNQLTYDLKSRPVGLRLVRDGYLYIYEKTGLFYEYKLKDGLPEQLLWAHTKLPDADKRTVDQKQDLKLLFNRTSTIYVCYSEIQWTMAKCKQIMGSPTECDHKMQKVNLSAVDCQQGGVHLLTKAQYEAFQSELNDDKLIINDKLNQLKTDQTVTEQSPLLKSYVWEENHDPAKGKESAQKLQSLVDNEYKDDHLYLVIRDDIGMLRDLAEYQDKIVKLRKAWHNDKDIQHKFGIGCYVKSLYEINEKILNNVAKNSDDFKEFEQDLNQEQKKSVVEYIATRSEKTYASEDSWYYYLPLINRTTGYDDWTQKAEQAKQKMKQSLGDKLYKKYSDYIEAMDANTVSALNGANFGSQGIQDRVNRPAMEKYLAEQERYFSYINTLVEQINLDRMTLFKAKAFLTSAWHYCAQSKEQTEQHGQLHYEAYKDLGLGEKQLDTIANLINSNSTILYPILYTLPAKDRDDIGEKMRDIVQNLKDVLFADKDYKSSKQLSTEYRNLIQQAAPHALDLTGNFGLIDASINNIYDPAIQKEMANKIITLQEQLADNPLKLREILRENIPKSQLNRLLAQLDASGLTIEVSSLKQMEKFFADVEKATRLRAERKAHKEQRKKYEKGMAQKGLNQAEKQRFKDAAEAEKIAFKQKGIELATTEASIAAGLSPIAPESAEAGRIGFTLKGLTPAQITELHAAANDYRLGIKTASAKMRAFTGHITGNGFAILMVISQVKGFASAVIKYHEKDNPTFADRLEFYDASSSFFAATFGFTQALTASALELKLATYSSTAGKLTGTMKFGALLEPFSVFAYGFGMFAAMFSFGKQAKLLANTKEETDSLAVLSGLISLSASGGLTALNAYGTVRSAYVIINIYRVYKLSGLVSGLFSVGWRSIAVIGRITLIGLGLALLEWLGSWLFNRYNIDKLDKWLNGCIWAKKPIDRRYSSLLEEDIALKEILNVPIVTQEGILPSGKTPYKKSFTFTFPNLTAEMLNTSQLKLSVSVLFEGAPKLEYIKDYTSAFAAQLQLVSKENGAITLAFDILDNMRRLRYPYYSINIEYPIITYPQIVTRKASYTFNGDAYSGSKTILLAEQANPLIWNDPQNLQPITLDDILIEDNTKEKSA